MINAMLMRRSRVRFFAAVLAVLLPLSFASCHASSPCAHEAMAEFCARNSALSQGSVYHVPGDDYGEDTLSPALAEALYGDPLSFLEGGAVYLGADLFTPHEAGIFVCRTKDDAHHMATLCLERLYTLRKLAPAAETLRGSEVRIFGRTVVYTVLANNERAMDLWADIL